MGNTIEARGSEDVCHLPTGGKPILVRIINQYRNTYSVWMPDTQWWWVSAGGRRKAFGTRSTARAALCKWQMDQAAKETGTTWTNLGLTRIKSVTVKPTPPKPTRNPLPTPLFTRTHEPDNGYYDTDMSHYARARLRGCVHAWLNDVHRQAIANRVEPIDRFDLIAMTTMELGEMMLQWTAPEGGA